MGAAAASAAPIEIAILSKIGGPLTKRISLAPDGALVSDGSACTMSVGTASRARLDDLTDFAALVGALASNQAIALGALHPDLPDPVRITTKSRFADLNGPAPPDLIVRTGEHIAYHSGGPALALIDVDAKGMPGEVKGRIVALGGFVSAIVSVLPELGLAGRVTRRSTSAGLSRADTGEQLPGSNGLHLFVLVTDGGDVERFLRTLHDRCWLAGLGWMMVGGSGQLLERSLIDRMVYAPERLVFEGAPILAPPLIQDYASRAPVVSVGASLDTRSACPSLTMVEMAKLRELRAAERHRLAPESGRIRDTVTTQRTTEVATRTGCSFAAAVHLVKCQYDGVLLPNVVLPFDVTEFDGATVGGVLADPERFVGATLADPLEGLAYGRCKAKILRREDGSLWIHSFAHGRTTYDLKYDAGLVEAAIRAAAPDEAVQLFIRLLLMAELEPVEEQRLRDLVTELTGVRARPLTASIKAASAERRQRRAQEALERRAAERNDLRVKLNVPKGNAELLPIARAIDDVLHASVLAEPPTRDLELWPAEVRSREALRLHSMNANDSNAEE